MVSTRHHPRPFPEPTTPSARTSPTKLDDARPTPPSASSIDSSGTETKSSTRSTRTSATRKSTTRTGGGYVHHVQPLVVLWFMVSLPLVIWDTGYVFLRPHSMPGGKYHNPIWSPYRLYGEIDYIYGWPAWNDGVGFTAAQGALNAIETAAYLYYLAVLSKYAAATMWRVWEAQSWTAGNEVRIQGADVAIAVLISFAASVTTLTKTILYWLNEYFSNFENIGHNSWSNLFWLWIVPNGMWILFPTYVIYVLGKEIVAAMNGKEREN